MLGRRRYGRLQRQADRCFIANEGLEVSGPELRSWCFPRAVWIEQRPITEYERQSMCRAARSIGAYRVRRDGRVMGVAAGPQRAGSLTCMEKPHEKPLPKCQQNGVFWAPDFACALKVDFAYSVWHPPIVK
jgi:hypothetical protein